MGGLCFITFFIICMLNHLQFTAAAAGMKEVEHFSPASKKIDFMADISTGEIVAIGDQPASNLHEPSKCSAL